MAILTATNNKYGDVTVTVDDKHAQKLAEVKWFANYDKSGKVIRIRTKMKLRGCKRTIPLEKYILYIANNNNTTDTCVRIIHVNKNPLDYCSSNLRVSQVITKTKQQFPGLVPSKTLRGVFYDQDYHSFRAKYLMGEKWVDLGSFKTADEAAGAWDVKARSMGVPEHMLNFPTM